MRPVRPIVKRITWWFCGVVAGIWIISYIGFIWGLPPYPHPPNGVRLETLKKPLTLTELTPENAAYYYAKAIRMVQSAHLPRQSTEEVDGFLNGGLTNGDTAIHQAITDYGDILEIVNRGIALRNCQMPCDFSEGAFSNSWTYIRQFAGLLCCEGKLAEQEQLMDTAISNYLNVVKLGTDCGKGSTTLGYLVSGSADAQGLKAIRSALLRQHATLATTASTRSRLDEMGSGVQPASEVLRYELWFAKRNFDSIVASNGNWALPRPHGARVFDATIGDMIVEADKPFWQSDPKSVVRKWDPFNGPKWKLVVHQPIATIMADMLLSGLETIHAREMRFRLDFEATEIVCAIQSFVQVHGHPPDMLNGLVPDLLPSIPIDPFDGKPLRYRREGKEWVLWSVGSDLKDDNAAWHEFKYRKPGDDRKGGDIYFKSTEPQDDLAFYLSQQKLKASEPAPSQRSPTASSR